MVDGLAARPLPPHLWPVSRVVDLSFRQSGANDHGDPSSATAAACDNASAAASDDSSPCGTAVQSSEGGAEGGHQQHGLGPEYRKLLSCPNLEETNSAVEVTYQVIIRRYIDGHNFSDGCPRLPSTEATSAHSSSEAGLEATCFRSSPSIHETSQEMILPPYIETTTCMKFTSSKENTCGASIPRRRPMLHRRRQVSSAFNFIVILMRGYYTSTPS